MLLALSLSGCVRSGIRIVPVAANEVLELSADDIVLIMQKVGFTNDQILDYGPAIQEALKTRGSAKVLIDGQVEIILSIKQGDVYIGSLSRGLFIYNPQVGWKTSNAALSNP